MLDALLLDGRVDLDGGLRERRVMREWPPRGGSVASGPRASRMQPGAVGRGHLAQRGGLAREEGVDRVLCTFR